MHETKSEDNPFPRLVYMTPEYLMGNRNNKKAGGAIQTLFKLDENIGLIVVDECHKVFDRSGDFRLCYQELRTLKDVFPSVPMMATTATLHPEKLDILRKEFLREPVIIQSSINRPNMKIHLQKYRTQSKPRPKKSQQGTVGEEFKEWEIWRPVSQSIKDVVEGENFSIIYMDFVKNVKELRQCMQHDVGEEVAMYTGKGMTSTDKAIVAQRFRDKEFKILLATEAYEVGVHNEHVTHIFRVGAPRNLTVLLQEFGRAGRGEKSAECWLYFNEYKDDQRLHHWLIGADESEKTDLKYHYQEVWRFIYQELLDKCLREALVEHFGEDSDTLEVGKDGCGCDSCVLSSPKVDEQRNMVLLLKNTNFLKESYRSEKKIVTWLKGGGDKWLKEDEIQVLASTSETFGKGNGKEGWYWTNLLKQAVALKFLDIIFLEFKFGNIARVVRRFRLTEKGRVYLENPDPVFLPNTQPTRRKERTSAARVKESNKPIQPGTNKGKHYLPKIKKILENHESWTTIKDGDDYMYPGFKASALYCPDWKELALSSSSGDFFYHDCQLSTAGTHSTKHRIEISGTETDIFVKRGQCEGVKVCKSEGCNYVVSRSQLKNRCQQHRKSEPLVPTGRSPVNIVYIIPVDVCDRRRWILTATLDDHLSQHNHAKPSPHLLPTLLKKDIAKALRTDHSLTAIQLQKGKGLEYMPSDMTIVAANVSKIRRVKEDALKESGGGKMRALNVVMDFNNIIAKKEDSERTFDDKHIVEKLADPYPMKGTAYIFQESQKHAFFQNPYQARLMSEAEFLNIDVTFTENPTFPYLLNMVAFDYLVLEWVAVSRVLMDRQTTESLRVAFENVFESTTAQFPSFNKGKSLQGITVDFSDAEAKALHEVLGEDLAPNLLRGCKVHWQRSYTRVGAMVCDGQEEITAFKTIASLIANTKEKSEVLSMFDILGGEKQVPLKYGAIDNSKWIRLKKWKQWWTREEHLRMFTIAFQTMAAYDKCPSTTNPVENINRGSSPGKGGAKTLTTVLKHLYKTDKLAVAKRVSTEKNVTKNYSNKSEEARVANNDRKRNWRRSKGGIEDDAEGPPDKKAALAMDKEKKGAPYEQKIKSLVGRLVKVEIEDGAQTTRWYNGVIRTKTPKGYRISFKGYGRSHDITVPCEDVPSDDIILL